MIKLYKMLILILYMLFVACMGSSRVCAKTTLTHIDKEIADDMCRVAVQYNGRICPLNTPATEFLAKLSGKNSWQGLSANEVFVSWMIYYTEWEEQKIILVKNREVQRMLGIDDKWASVHDFYTPKHEYKLSDKVNDETLSPALLNAVRETDEKMQVVAMFYNSEMLHIFPLSVKDSVTGRMGELAWYTPGSTELPLGTPTAEFQFINHAMDRLTQCILVNDVKGAKEVVAKIRLYQREKADCVMPSERTLRMELSYNRLQQARWLVYLFLTLSFVLCMLSLIKGENRRLKSVQYVFVLVAMHWLSLLFFERWWLAGHVPVSSGPETMLFMAWASLVMTLFMARRMPILLSFAPIVSALCMLVATIAQKSPQITPLMPALQTPLLSIHVSVIMISYVLFAMITLLAAYSLWLRSGERFERMTATIRLLLYPAVALLAVGIVVGSIWAKQAWGAYWSWDPKETCALITLIVYAIPLFRRFIPFTPRWYNLYILFSFLSVLMTYFGANYFLPGMHSYA